MNLLQIVQRACTECGISGDTPSTIETSSGALTDEVQRIVNWCIAANTDIESAHHDWPFMRLSAQFDTVQGQQTYALGTGVGTVGVTAETFGAWVIRSFRNYVTANGNISEIMMFPILYEEWRNAYLYGATRYAYTRPLEFAVGPNMEVCPGPITAAGYTITGDYFRKPITLVQDDDSTPAIPSEYHMMLVYKCMEYYGQYESAPEVVMRGRNEFFKMMRRLSTLRLQRPYF